MRLAFVVGVTWLIACGGGSSGPPSVSTSKDNVCDQIADVVCYDIYQCCAEGEIENDLGIQNPESQDQCTDDIKRRCVRGLATYESSLAGNRVTFDASVMNTCLSALLPGSAAAARPSAAICRGRPRA